MYQTLQSQPEEWHGALSSLAGRGVVQCGRPQSADCFGVVEPEAGKPVFVLLPKVGNAKSRSKGPDRTATSLVRELGPSLRGLPAGACLLPESKSACWTHARKLSSDRRYDHVNAKLSTDRGASRFSRQERPRRLVNNAVKLATCPVELARPASACRPSLLGWRAHRPESSPVRQFLWPLP